MEPGAVEETDGTGVAGDAAGWGQVLYRSVVAVSLGVIGSAVALDALSVTADSQFIYARSAYALIGLGLLAMVVAVVFVVAAIAVRPSGSPQRQAGIVHLVVLDIVLAWFALAWFQRRDQPLAPVALWEIAVSGLVVLAAVASHLWELRASQAPADRV